MAALTAVVNAILEPIVERTSVTALEQSARHISISLATRSPLSRTQQRHLAAALRPLTSTVRWITSTTMRIALPIAILPDAALALCVPILRLHRNTLWWPIASTGHLLLAGDAQGALTAMLYALMSVAEKQPMTFALHDPDRELRALPQLTATPDALATARLRALRVTWAARQQQAISPDPPLILVVVAPDTLVWRDLAPLLGAPVSGVHTLVLLNGSADIAEARDACHRVPVLEIGGPGVVLPESYRPPGVLEPRAGEALAWRPDRLVWRGTPLKSTE
jgi:hypothetical protein